MEKFKRYQCILNKLIAYMKNLKNNLKLKKATRKEEIVLLK
jgi:hypothetical protein